RVMAEHQPAKAAAAAGNWHGGSQPAWVLFGWPDSRTQSNRAEVALDGVGGAWLGRDAQGRYLGLDKYSGMQPPVPLTFWSLRLMLLLGLLMLLVSCTTLALTARRGMDPMQLPRWWLRLMVGMLYAGGLAVLAGGVFAVSGMQPYAVNATITQTEVLGTADTYTLSASLAGYVLLYGLLLVAFNGMLFHAARYGVVPVRKPGKPAPSVGLQQ
ncbi:cytochrome ubiquinol oxidase subunit I, partial [Bordetella petrii]|uniref:cytochrome ubiquinol oxidase subunit I n=1 Tax=Bordetella petrii TaxID=94624 RepID=UPI001E3E3D35